MLELLPRAPPALYTDAELLELERRLANLDVFDLVRVTRMPAEIVVLVREKWTLIPMFELSTGSTWRDTYVALSATEYNLLGRALVLMASVWHEARGWNGSLELTEHTYHPSRGAFGGRLQYASAEYWFNDSGDAWTSLGPILLLTWQAPTPHGRRLSYQFGAAYGYEHNVDPIGRYKPFDGNHMHVELTIGWENLRWSDFAPNGMRFKLKLAPGMFLSDHAPQPRLAAEGEALLASAFSPDTVLMSRAMFVALNRGNGNFSALLASVGGVRGVPDAEFRAWALAQINVELRHAFRLAERWALQLVMFGDAAAFDRLTAGGGNGASGWAASSGAGLRLIPSFLAGVVLRIDVGRAYWPEPGWFWQWGLNQYF